jgi:hypothetical protein
MKIILSTHVETNLYFRGIDGWKVKEVVKSPSWKRTQKDGTMATRRVFEGRTLEVIYAQHDNIQVIITAYYVN